MPVAQFPAKPVEDRLFSDGDTVCLKSGGSFMTVRGFEKGEYNCRWHNSDGDLYDEWFLPTELMTYAEAMEEVQEERQKAASGSK